MHCKASQSCLKARHAQQGLSERICHQRLWDSFFARSPEVPLRLLLLLAEWFGIFCMAEMPAKISVPHAPARSFPSFHGSMINASFRSVGLHACESSRSVSWKRLHLLHSCYGAQQTIRAANAADFAPFMLAPAGIIIPACVIMARHCCTKCNAGWMPPMELTQDQSSQLAGLHRPSKLALEPSTYRSCQQELSMSCGGSQ